jgi:hypothetical protein
MTTLSYNLLKILNWDFKFFEDLLTILQNFELAFEDIVDDVQETDLDPHKIESYYKIALDKIDERIKVVLKYHYPQYWEDIEEYSFKGIPLKEYSLKELKKNEEMREILIESIYIRG